MLCIVDKHPLSDFIFISAWAFLTDSCNNEFCNDWPTSYPMKWMELDRPFYSLERAYCRSLLLTFSDEPVEL